MKNLQTKITIGVVVFIVLSLIALDFFAPDERYFTEEITVAACPTFHYLADKLDINEQITIIKTNSTPETIAMVEDGVVDFGIARRSLLENRPVSYQVAGPGYDIISSVEFVIGEEDMSIFSYYTDIDKNKILRDFNYIGEENITVVDNPLDYISDGIVITVLQGGMTNEMQNIHVIASNDKRLRMSSLPILYYMSETGDSKLRTINTLIDSIYEN